MQLFQSHIRFVSKVKQKQFLLLVSVEIIKRSSGMISNVGVIIPSGSSYVMSSIHVSTTAKQRNFRNDQIEAEIQNRFLQPQFTVCFQFSRNTISNEERICRRHVCLRITDSSAERSAAKSKKIRRFSSLCFLL